jgi:predicted DNA-binding transcriptional regulator AlpA
MHTANNQFEITLISTEAAAKCLGTSKHWLKATRYRPELDGPKFCKIGRNVRYDLRDIAAWIEERKFRGTHEVIQAQEAK